VEPLPEEHTDCVPRAAYEKALADVAALRSENSELKRRLYGRKSEKMPSPASELRRRGRKPDPTAARRRRQATQQAKAELPEERIEHRVPSESCTCPKCGSTELKPLGAGEERIVYERVPEHFVRQVHVLQKLACGCGEHIVQAKGPRRVGEQCTYGPGLIAHLVTSKCADSTPFYRLEKQCKRSGMPLARSTMVDLFHLAARELKPIYDELLRSIARWPIVQADETTLKMQDGRKGWVWTFLNHWMIAYVFTTSRSGQTPLQVLGGTPGTLVVDAYTGYNRVTTPDGRERAGCLAHLRRKLFEALDGELDNPEPAIVFALDRILDVYRVEHDAREQGIVGGKRHLAMRQQRAGPSMQRLHEHLVEQEPKWPPRSKLGKAIGYALKQWKPLTRFLHDAKVPVDNNASERALRVVALGRKNYLFVGHEDAGQNTAILYSLVASCEANDVNPEEYLADMLLRVQTHPADKLVELLPHAWVPEGM
jgi:transposase